MNDPNHQDYYTARAANARDMARRAASPAIAAIHAELATRYDMMAAEPVIFAEAMVVSQAA